MKNTIESTIEKMQFGIHDGEEFIPINDEDDVKKYAKKFGLNEKMLSIISDMYDDLKYNINEDLTDIWKRLNKMESGIKNKL